MTPHDWVRVGRARRGGNHACRCRRCGQRASTDGSNVGIDVSRHPREWPASLEDCDASLAAAVLGS